MNLKRLAWILLLLVLLVPARAARHTSAQTSAFGLQSVVTLPKSPANFDIGWVDAASRRYYLADRTNAAVDVVDVDSGALIAQLGGFVGFTGKNNSSGPNGVVTVPDRNELWVGDGDSTVKVIDLSSGTVVASISTGGTLRADELDYDAADHLIIVANDADEPPYLTAIDTITRQVQGRLDFPNATDGLEQPAYDRASGMIYQAVPASKQNPGGEIAVIQGSSGQLVRTYPLSQCNPHGLVIGANGNLLVGCNGGDHKNTIIMSTSGNLVATIMEVGGSDQVWYNPGDNRYYLGASGMTADGSKMGTVTPVLGIIDATTNTWIQNVPTVTGAHSVAADSRTNRVFVPLTNVGIGIYGTQGAGRAPIVPAGPPNTGEGPGPSRDVPR